MIFRPSSRKALCLLVLLLLPVPGLSAPQQDAREIMANAMARMMDAMGLFDSTAGGQSGFGLSADPLSAMGPSGAAGWGSPYGMPWGGPLQDPSRAFAMGEAMRQFSEHVPGRKSPFRDGWPAPWTASRLEGVWEGRDGELLVVQGNRFRIYSPDMKRVEGLIQIRGERLALFNPQNEHAQPFKFAESQGRLVMRDLAGRDYLYRRLRLDGGQSGAMITTTPER